MSNNNDTDDTAYFESLSPCMQQTLALGFHMAAISPGNCPEKQQVAAQGFVQVAKALNCGD